MLIIVAAVPMGHVDRRNAHADRAHEQSRRGLVAAAEQDRAVDRMAAQKLLGLHRQKVAIEHGGRLDERLGKRHRRQFQRKAARLQHAALDVVGARAQMRVAGINVAPGIDDGDHGLAAPIACVIADLPQARAMAEGAQIAHPEPAMAAQIFGTLFRAHHCDLSRRYAAGGCPHKISVGKRETLKGAPYSAVSVRQGARKGVLHIDHESGI
jgi:hypothetical protein